MKKSTKYKLVLSLVTSVTAGLGSLQADDATPTETTPAPITAPATVASPVVVSGKIIVVDKIARTITVDVAGKLKLIKVGAKVKMVDNGKLIRFEDLVAGQEVAVLTQDNEEGIAEAVALSVETTGALEAAGKAKDKEKKVKEVKGLKGGGNSGGGPFQNFPNPANNLGPVVSPSR
jgi:hypothetical protein